MRPCVSARVSDAPSNRTPVQTVEIGSIAAGALTSGAIFAAIAFYVLFTGHPHEDAYILFIYSETLAETGRVAYYPGGPPTEGATDFLWMLAIAALSALGSSGGVAAALLNTAGSALIGGLLVEGILRTGGSRLVACISVVFAPILLAAQSGYGGFSAPCYAALGLLIFRILWLSQPTSIWRLPFLGVLMGLFRPDGVVIGIGATLAGLVHGATPRYLGAMAASAALGAFYMMWRWSYFDEFLPLPLIVKTSSTVVFPGIGEIVVWLDRVKYLVLAAIISTRFLPQGRGIALALVPFVLHLAALAFATHSQNVAFRFVAPETLVLFYIVALGTGSMVATRLRFALIPVVALLALNAQQDIRSAVTEVRYLTNSDYINFLPQNLAEDVPGDATLVLTEAGRFAYWLPGRKVDLVGLNTAHTAHNGADAAYIASLNPDLIFFHVASTVAISCDAPTYCEVSLAELLADRRVNTAATDVADRVVRASLAVLEFLSRHSDEYRIFAVSYGGGYNHVYAVAKQGRISADALTRALDRSFREEGRLGYVAGLEDRPAR